MTYLWGWPFIIKTNHYNLKFLLDQHLATIPQHQWVSKLSGFDFRVEFKPGRLNTVADALSRRDVELGSALAISGPSFDFLAQWSAATSEDPVLVALQEQIEVGTLGEPWALTDSVITYRHIYLPLSSAMLSAVLAAVHEGHEGVQKTLHRLCPTSTRLTRARHYRSSSMAASPTKGTKWSTSTWSVVSCSCPCHRSSRQMSPWTSLKAYPTLEENQSSSWWWIDSQSTTTSSRYLTHIQRKRWLEYSSLRLCPDSYLHRLRS